MGDLSGKHVASPGPAIATDLTEVEQSVIDGVLAGHLVDLGSHPSPRGLFDAWWSQDGGAAPDFTEPGRLVRSEVLGRLLTGGFGTVPPGRVHLRGVRILGALDLSGRAVPHELGFDECVFDSVDLKRSHIPLAALFLSRTGPFSAYGARIEGELWLTYNEFTDRVVIGEARIGGLVELQGSVVAGGVDETRPGSSLAFSASGAEVGSVIGLAEADLRGDVELDFTRSRLVRLAHCRVAGDLSLAGADTERVVLTGAQVSGELHLVGFAYKDLDPWRPLPERLASMPRGRTFHTQPWEQLATMLRTHGQDAAARTVSIERERARTGALSADGAHAMSTSRRAVRHLFDLGLGYGYQPWRAWVVLAGVVVAAALTFGWAADNDGLVPTDSGVDAVASRCESDYPCFNRWLYASDVTIPLVTVGQEAAWRVDASAPSGSWIAAFFWLSRVLGWGAATLAVAAVTGLVTRR